MNRYFLKLDVENFEWLGVENAEWREVSLAQFIDAEHAAGFRGGNLERGCTATASFSGNGVRGRVEYGGRTRIRRRKLTS